MSRKDLTLHLIASVTLLYDNYLKLEIDFVRFLSFAARQHLSNVLFYFAKQTNNKKDHFMFSHFSSLLFCPMFV